MVYCIAGLWDKYIGGLCAVVGCVVYDCVVCVCCVQLYVEVTVDRAAGIDFLQIESKIVFLT